MKPGTAAKIAVRSLVRTLGAESECGPCRSAARQTPLMLHRSTTSASVDPDVLIFIITPLDLAASSNYLGGPTPFGDTTLAKGYLACFMDTTAEGLTFASFSPNYPESEA
jgi:hypothetical protein